MDGVSTMHKAAHNAAVFEAWGLQPALIVMRRRVPQFCLEQFSPKGRRILGHELADTGREGPDVLPSIKCFSS